MPSAPPEPIHGDDRLPSVRVTSYNLETREDGGFLGDKVSETAFRKLLDDWRQSFAGRDEDPLGSTPTDEIRREDLDKTFEDEEAPAADLLGGAADEFSQELAAVLGRFLLTPGWAGVQRIVCGGGFQSSAVGRAIVRRASGLLAADKGVTLRSLKHDPDDGGMIGWVHAAPTRLLRDGEGMLAVDVGGTNLRCGIVRFNRDAAGSCAQADVHTRRKWCHADEEPSREDVIDALCGMLVEMAAKAKDDGLRLVPLVGLSCPGIILPDGRIHHGTQNLPGDWTDDDFNLSLAVAAGLAEGDDRPPVVLVHNDAVVRGLSERPFMRDVERWGAITIGTGLGNCSFLNTGEESGAVEAG
ncbi:hypothetical protein ASG43_08540 [Aureimonas sp. Leaf454]|uniref:ROK family protein n=1 Tax=Aureimonas sp. Leaf454 TaxID=1736381 RepID=UPI0006F54EA1|nr:ROK family protein [Aureimonas sp. Leaf454]KQT48880.1 hypothetical protein ASG43_08540 [Aureimonas sp. Leaf454]